MTSMENEPAPEEKRPLRILDLQSAILKNAVLQSVFLMLTALILDGGLIGRTWMQAMMAYWLMTGWLAFRRGNALTTVDALLIRMGFFLWLAVTLIVKINSALHFGGL